MPFRLIIRRNGMFSNIKRMKKQLFLSLFLPVLFAFAACSSSEDDVEGSEVSVSTPILTASTGTSLTVTSSVTGGSNHIVSRGFCYSVNTQNPTIRDNMVDADENFSATISGLTANTSYYIRAYVYSDSHYIYSNALIATTESIQIDEQLQNYVAPTYVDNYVNIAGWDQRSQWNLANVHDPSVVLADDGYYYMYQTDASYGNAHEGHGHFHTRRSRDLVNWEYLGGTMSEAPAWVLTRLNEYRHELGLSDITNPQYGYWAPVVRRVRSGLYRMYYSIVVDNYIGNGQPTSTTFDGTWSERAFIGLAECTDPATNQWEDKGFVTCSASDKGTNWRRASTNDWEGYFKWNAIDPSYLIAGSEHWLIYGSWHSGIVALQLNAETGKPLATLPNPWGSATDIAPYGVQIETRGGRWQGSEGPEIVYHDGYYYLFVAYDALGVPYNTRVCRSTNITGPYLGMDGTNVTDGGEMYPVLTHPYKFSQGDGWVGISHCAVFDDGQGNWYYSSQARFPENVGGNAYSNAIMMGQIRSIRWTEGGWPIVMPERYGAVPQVAITEDELVGDWEHIDLGYSYGTQKTASKMTLSANHTVTEGTWQGTSWSFDEAKQMLTCNDLKLYLQRECDWERSPRIHTIVYAGFNDNGTKTYWGKKSK